MVQLTAMPKRGYRFTGWSGSSTEKTETITVTMTCDKTYTAHFIAVRHRLNTTVSPATGGDIILLPQQPDGGYVEGTVVTLRARPASGYHFKEWSGDASGKHSVTSLIIDSEKTATATFVENEAFNLVWVLGGAGVLVAGMLIYTIGFRRR